MRKHHSALSDNHPKTHNHSTAHNALQPEQELNLQNANKMSPQSLNPNTVLQLQRTIGNQATIQLLEQNNKDQSTQKQATGSNFFSGLRMVNRKEKVQSTTQSEKPIQRVPLTQRQFGSSISDLIFGTSYPVAKQTLGRRFVTDLVTEANGEYDSSLVMKIGNPVTKFVANLNDALKYRADNANIVRSMQRQRRGANFGDLVPDRSRRLLGGTNNAWPSLGENKLPSKMQNKMPGYVNGLHASVSMGGSGYDYRPSKGVLFHIKK